METRQDIRLLMGIEVYFPYVDGVVICMDNYCKNLLDKTELFAIASKDNREYFENS